MKSRAVVATLCFGAALLFCSGPGRGGLRPVRTPWRRMLRAFLRMRALVWRRGRLLRSLRLGPPLLPAGPPAWPAPSQPLR
jgi:hypothetical protein